MKHVKNHAKGERVKKGRKPTTDRNAKRARRVAAIPPKPEPSAEDRRVALTIYVAPPPKQRTVRDIFEAVCARITQGERIHAACSAERTTWRQLWMWKAQDHELHALYARAREASGESWEDRSTETVETATKEDVQLARLKEDNYRWRAKMANPKQYGDKVDLTSAGARIGLEELVAGSMERKPA
ncbi:MAG TPA: hypothetical protein VGI97_14820 [Gemmatimonadaceae bacterium]